MAERYEAVVIGTGFGGSINACRLSKRWPGQVLVLERGKRYPLGGFPRSPHDFSRNFWNIPGEDRERPGRMEIMQGQRGLFDVRNYGHMDVVLSAGLGGGSLIYANVFLEPPDAVFDQRWPVKKGDLLPYYRIAKEVLGSRPIPEHNGDPRRRILRTELFEHFAAQLGRDSKLVDINVFFGNDFANPLEIGVQDRNRYGALQTSCVYCAECDVGCNYQAKNTLDLNYLYVAEHRYHAEVLTEHLAERIVPLDADGRPDTTADGSHGYEVHYRDLTTTGGDKVARTNRVVVSAGTLGSTELLLRCRDVFGTLPNISERLGLQFSGNGDFLSFVLNTKPPADPNYGPVITQRVDFNLFENFDPDRAFILEDASYPNFLAWFTEGIKPGFLRFPALWATIRHVFSRWVKGNSAGRIGYALHDILTGDLSYRTAVLLCMGIDRSNGVMSLEPDGQVAVHWPWRDSLALYKAILQAGRDFKRLEGGEAFIPLPTWDIPWRKNVSVHPLGGCVIGGGPDSGVTSDGQGDFGRVFGYQNLHVADGALLPTAVGANPTATISALSEMVAEAITGIAPDADL